MKAFGHDDEAGDPIAEDATPGKVRQTFGEEARATRTATLGRRTPVQRPQTSRAENATSP